MLCSGGGGGVLVSVALYISLCHIIVSKASIIEELMLTTNGVVL